ncbi:unnamed protein product [Didymodactylos carnosus]|uniref:Enoyl reductase (ER) domain-containing protein n=1 Tax=Didymodactylos carnosus TaxID=1234261 RepID=A0A814DFX6_9BILA|nr:unnamed protein product [Didymodactylos carnosus]CAF1133972.1 unnamed protein product [Didymodactylos carnosus]CAF3731517.1 unnamed protein product [Didymodactylos carnosus]CAF3920707.1 unnamed protein product [Didymodactylos carnosus]
MRAVLLKDFGDISNMYIGETAVPKPKDDEVLIKVHAFGVNRADTSQRQGKYPPPPGNSDIMGLEAAGEIVQLGGEAKQFNLKVGDQVMTLVGGGGYAEYVTAHVGCVMHIPKGLSMIEAAAIPETFLTAFQGLRTIAHLKKDDIVLVHAGASGVGTAAIQLVKLFGAHCCTTAGSEKKLEYCKKLGAEVAFNYKQGPWLDTIKKFATDQNKDGVDIVYDSIGKDYIEQNQEVLGTNGRWVVYSTQSGATADKLSLNILMKKRIQLTGTVLRARPKEYKTELVKNFKEQALDGFTNGTLKCVIDKVFPFEQVADAHAYIEADKTMGKLVIQIL